MTLRAGQKVVLVRDDWPYFTWCINLPRKGEVYTIRAIVDGFDGIMIRDGVLLEEITNPLSRRGVEYSFYPERFRPLVDKKTDISIFTAMLNPKKARERS